MVMSFAGLETKNDCASKDQQLQELQVWEWMRVREPAESLPSSETPPVIEEKAPFQNTQKSGKNKNMVVGSEGARNEERLCRRGQEAIYWTGLDWTGLSA
jgi:hypothetical protein